MSQGCGNSECSCSTGIHDGLTFGRGRLDEYGYWEFPCPICARGWDAEVPQVREKIRNDLKAKNPNWTDQQLDSFLRSNHEWLFIEGWPFAHQDAAQLTAEFHQHYHQEDDLDREMQDMFPELYDYDPVEAE